VVRTLNALFYAAFCALGFSLCARPALLELRGLGLLGWTLPWDVPLGRLFLLLALAHIAFTLRLMLAQALRARVSLAERAVYLLLVAAALGARALAGEPAPPRSPDTALLDALKATGDQLDLGFLSTQRYAPDAAALDQRLAALPPPGFVRRAQPARLHVRLETSATGPRCTPAEGDTPGTVIVALDAGQTRAWLCALTLADGRVQPLKSSGRPLILQARQGSHSAPGRDPLLPEYPTMQLLKDRTRAKPAAPK
jgi:hypothetical protein